MQYEYVLNVRTSDFEDMRNNLKRDGWLNNFTDAKNQSMREDGVLWRGAREKCPEFFSIILSALTEKNEIIMDWQCDIGLFFISRSSGQHVQCLLGEFIYLKLRGLTM